MSICKSPNFIWFFHGRIRYWVDVPMVSKRHIYHATKTVLHQWLPQLPAPQGRNSLSATIRPSAPYPILFSLFPSIDQLVSDSLLNASSPPPPHDSHSRLSQIPGASTPHPFFIFYVSHDVFLFLEPEGTFPSSELLQCPVLNEEV